MNTKKAKKRKPAKVPKPKASDGRNGGGRLPTLEEVGVAAALAEYGGNMAAVARRFHVARSAVHAFVHAHPTLLQVMTDQLEGRLDNAESALDRALIKGEAWAVCFFLKTRGKSRGYIEKSQLDIGGSGILPVIILPSGASSIEASDDELNQRIAELEVRRAELESRTRTPGDPGAGEAGS